MSDVYRAPTGALILGTFERVDCRCEIHGVNDDGTPDYAGSSAMFWDETHPVERDGKPLFLDEKGEQWTFDQLVKEPIPNDQSR
jgi:hypothetical protein